MGKDAKTAILSVLIIITTFIIIRRFTVLYFEFKNIDLPTKASRQIGDMSTHKWITVKKMSKKYNISEEEIFKTLEIVPQQGDENLYIKDLGKKYNKPLKDMKDNLKKIIESDKNIQGNRDIEGKKHE
ncbi:hypothetical protein G9F71_007785 [Clostridium sp. FP2]|uniref:hypothetical protein n=1 Tax=Clostridium TaxID=1485 RepID=UPI0013E96E6D|nr:MULTISPECIES: hypothetical protein [Clostridium]MBW9157670.1 hypothetical protein [Clostridium tagluense]MBZ9622751.1 hypothetical protein [Clostridium sp. FP2]WLC67031.1 hypothetical protein KTC93_07560 [Clostridium tagluense]